MSIEHSATFAAALSRPIGLRWAGAFHSAAPMGAVLAVQAVFGSWIFASYGVEPRNFLRMPYDTALFLLIMLPMSIAFICIYRMVRYTRPVSPIRALVAGLRAYAGDRDRWVNGLPVIAILVPFMLMFVDIKAGIPLVAPFSWDVTLTAWDRALFFGSLPYEWLQPLVGYPIVSFVLDILYKLWFILMWMSLVGFAFSRTVSALRTQYCVSFLLTWFLQGSVLAIAISSAGPCYYGLLEDRPDPYAPLMTYLRQANLSLPISALDMQALLWSGYRGEVEPLGISAAPSLHNATSLLMALAAWKMDRRLGLIFFAFAAVIFVGSIALAWHYAVDGLIAFPVTLAIWFAGGQFAAWWERPGQRRSSTRR